MPVLKDYPSPVITIPTIPAALRNTSSSPGGRGVGADGAIVEIHPEPEKAFSDGAQSLRPEEFYRLMDEVTILADAMHNGIGRLR